MLNKTRTVQLMMEQPKKGIGLRVHMEEREWRQNREKSSNM
ncbi:hypothetical protein [Bacillus gaemokensis]|nr:hypothetical protein [Bacillus gaemokensis]